MTRKILPVIESENVHTETLAIVRPGKIQLERSLKENYHPRPLVTKTPFSRIPPPQVERIKQRHILGMSQRAIARVEGRSRPTIARIVKGEEMQAFVQEMRERLYGLAPDALTAIEHALRQQKDARIALEVLRDVGVAPRRGEPLPQPPVTEEDLQARQDRLVAAVITQRRRDFNIPLPAELKEAFEKADDGDAKMQRR